MAIWNAGLYSINTGLKNSGWAFNSFVSGLQSNTTINNIGAINATPVSGLKCNTAITNLSKGAQSITLTTNISRAAPGTLIYAWNKPVSGLKCNTAVSGITQVILAPPLVNILTYALGGTVSRGPVSQTLTGVKSNSSIRSVSVINSRVITSTALKTTANNLSMAPRSASLTGITAKINIGSVQYLYLLDLFNMIIIRNPTPTIQIKKLNINLQLTIKHKFL